MGYSSLVLVSKRLVLESKCRDPNCKAPAFIGSVLKRKMQVAFGWYFLSPVLDIKSDKLIHCQQLLAFVPLKMTP